MYWFKKCMKNYANFSGRARRKELWMFYLMCFLIFIGIGLVASMLVAGGASGLATLVGIAYIGFLLAIIIPGLAVVWRRLHDLDKSGAFYFIAFIPFIGGIILFVFLCMEGTRGENSYGEDSKLEDIAS